MRNPDGKLPVVTDEIEDCGGGCDRRVLLQGLAVATVAGACRIDVASDVDAAVGDSGVPDTGFELCGAGMVCVDLTHPMNAGIGAVDGARVIIQGTTRVIIIRTSTTNFVTLSARCTHAGTTVGYRVMQADIRCPNHGSQFELDGTVKLGPAVTALAEFDNTFDMPGNLLTIMIG